MNRLTNKKVLDEMYKFPKDYTFSTEELIYNKLGKFEDIEENFGVDLIKLLQASGIFVKEQNTDEKEIIFEEFTIDLENHLLLFRHPRKEIGKGRVISRYGITWAFTKEELEHE